MRIKAKLICFLIIALFTAFATQRSLADKAESATNFSSIVITFDPPIIDNCNQSAQFHNLLIRTIKSKPAGITEQIDRSGALWSASHSLCGSQFAIFHFDDPVRAVQICKNLLEQLEIALRQDFKKTTSREFADYIHSLPFQSNFVTEFEHNPVSISLSANMASYAEELTSASNLGNFFAQTSRLNQNLNVLPDVLPTVFTVFSWPQNNAAAFFTAKYLGEKFVREAGLDQLLKYEIIFGAAGLRLVVYLSGKEELLAEHMQKFRQIEQYRFSSEPPADWELFIRSLSEIMQDDRRDISKRALFDAWCKHWHADYTCLKADTPLAPSHWHSGLCLPEANSHKISFSSGLFPNFAAAFHESGDKNCDITIAISGDNQKIIDEIRQNLETDHSSVALTLVRVPEFLKIIFHCSTSEVSGSLARIRNQIYNNLVEKGLVSSPVHELRIGIAGVSNLPPFELRGKLQQGWSPVTHPGPMQPLTSYRKLFRVAEASTTSLRQRWQLHLASGRGRSELLAMLAATNQYIKDFNLPE